MVVSTAMNVITLCCCCLFFPTATHGLLHSTRAFLTRHSLGSRHSSNFLNAASSVIVETAAAVTVVMPPAVDIDPTPSPIELVYSKSRTVKIYRLEDTLSENESPPATAAAVPIGELKPALLFLPGLDGVGTYSQPIVGKLNVAFEVWKMETQGTDRSTFLEMAGFVNQTIGQLFPGRSVVLVGESFGGLLATYLALRAPPGKISQLVLVNPATSFGQTLWQTTGPLLANTGRMFPLVGLATLLGTAVDGDQFQRIGRKIMSSINSTDSAVRLLNGMFDSAKEMSSLLSAKTLTWRLSRWLGEGSFVMENRYKEIKTPTLILTGTNDRLLPSRDEGRRLKKALGSSVVELKEFNNGHALLEDGFVDLAKEMLRSPVFAPADRDIYDCPRPSAEDMGELEKQFGNIWKSMSPVFLTRNPAGGLRRGLKDVPSSSLLNRPVLLVGNHQFFGGDLGPIVRQFLTEKDTLIRGLAHPMIFASQAGGMGSAGQGEGSQGIFSKFGAVEVSPFSYYEMLKRNETIMLFPGGVKEALHGKGEDYQLFWPEKVDFVRMAAIFDCIIVPFAGVGIDDSVNILWDREDMKRAPSWMQGRNNSMGMGGGNRMPQARAGIVEDFSPSLFVPRPTGIERVYFLFQDPIDTKGIDPYNKKESRILYDKVRNQVQDGIDTLKQFREADPYRGFFARAVYEANSGGQPAPTAPLNSVK